MRELLAVFSKSGLKTASGYFKKGLNSKLCCYLSPDFRFKLQNYPCLFSTKKHSSQ